MAQHVSSKLDARPRKEILAAASKYHWPGRIQEELKQPAGWFCLSFATDQEFVGAAIVRGHGPLTAIERCKQLGWRDAHSGFLWVVIPHLVGMLGTIQHTTLRKQDMRHIPAGFRNRLLSEAEARTLVGRRAA